MTERNAYNYSPHPDTVRFLSHGIRIITLILYMLTFSAVASAQEEQQYDEIPVYVKIPHIGIREIDALIKEEEVYLPVSGLFNFLKIRNVVSDDLETVTGFFISPEEQYTISRADNQIEFGNKLFQLEADALIRTETSLYLKSVYYGKVFGLDCSFSFRDLMVTIDTKIELPVIREIRQEEMRKNLTRLKGEIQADTVIGRSYPGFRAGMADWSVYASQQPGGLSEGRFNLALGSVIAGGEATASLTLYTAAPFSEKQQHYLWRHVDNDRSWMRQIVLGKINTSATASLFNPVLGVQVTNTPTTFRRSFGTYSLTDRTEPGWTVELYVNNTLVDYVKADASGFFTFEVPLVYGNTLVKLKFYGPWGEERIREQNIIIPFNFLPHRELEYTLSAGMVEDSSWSRFSRADIRYGATKHITLGGGFEYLSSIGEEPLMPFVNASVRITNNLLLSADYTHGVRAKGTMIYRLPSNIQMDLNYIWYDRDQKAISFNYLDEVKASLSVPVKIKKMGAYSRLSYHRISFPGSKFTSAEWMVAGAVSGMSVNLATYGIFSDYFDPSLHSQLSLAFRLPANFVIMPQAQYNYTSSEFLSGKVSVEKRLMERGYLNLSFERNFRMNLTMGEIGMRYDFSFAQVGASARRSNEHTTLVQYARGSVISDRKTSFLKADNRTNVGRGGVSIIAYLDFNANGRRDEGEPKAGGLAVRSNSGRIEYSDKDSVIHIVGMEPYVKHFIEFDESNFSDISWRLHKKTYAIVTDANMLKMIEIPINVEGEAAGSVMLEKDGSKSGIGRVIVNIHRSDNTLLTKALTESDGYFSFFGLSPGSYYARIDTAQLRRLNLVSEPDSIVFSIMTNSEGDYVEGLDFILRKPELTPDTILLADSAAVADIAELPGYIPGTDTLKIVPPVPARTVAKDTSYLVIHEVTRELVTITEDYYAVQFGAFRTKLYAEIMKRKVEGALDKNVELFEEDGFWKVRITGFDDREDLEKYIPVIQDQGITEIWVITNKALKGEWISRTREDSLAVVNETVTEEPMPVVIRGTTVQLGAFSSLEETVTVSDRLLAAAEKLVTIRNEGGLFKVQITGFADTNEVREFIPLLRKYGFEDITVLHESESGLAPVMPVVPEPVIELPEDQEKAEVPVLQEEVEEIVPDLPAKVEEIAPPPPPKPRFVLHAGSYRREAEAERAKQKIEKRLKLPVEIIGEWESYRVVITGFFTREETYPYYPELAGLGFTDIFVYEKPLIDR
jgi:cell division protein FtsN